MLTAFPASKFKRKWLQITIIKATDLYAGKKNDYQFHREELLTVKNYFSVGVQESKTHG